MKKLIILISVIIIFFIFFLFMYFNPRNYEKTYEVDKIKITEKYDKEKEYYYFNFNYKKIDFEYAVTNKYTNKRGLINEVEIINKENLLCIIPKSEYVITYPLCYNGKEFIDYNLIDIEFDFKKELKIIDDNYKDTHINALNDKTVLVWNYKGFNYLKENNYKQINFLNKDTYNLELVAQAGNYLLTPDYNSEHSFQKMYVINLKNGSLKEWNLEYEIYYDSYIVGVNNNSVFLFDNKNEIEYELRPDKMKMRKVKFKAIIEGEWQNLSLGDLKKKTTFSRKSVYNYEVINNKLYLKYLSGENKILVSNKNVKDIIYVDNETVYYLVDDKLYMYNASYGEILLMTYFEWNFNYQNMIYIY